MVSGELLSVAAVWLILGESISRRNGGAIEVGVTVGFCSGAGFYRIVIGSEIGRPMRSSALQNPSENSQ